MNNVTVLFVLPAPRERCSCDNASNCTINANCKQIERYEKYYEKCKRENTKASSTVTWRQRQAQYTNKMMSSIELAIKVSQKCARWRLLN